VTRGRDRGIDEDDDRRWMGRALALARRGQGATRPNPMVGAVVVRGRRVLGQGFHERAGKPHAEINALDRLVKAAIRRGAKPGASIGAAAGTTVYVTLEPCCHTGRTAPCVDTLIAAGVARVVVGVRDPNPLVNGRGIALLRRAGIRVDVGCREEECRLLNRPFFSWVQKRRPLVTLKIASTLDGVIADRRPHARASTRVWITGAQARLAAHELRAEHDAILVGAGTVQADDPLLTVRLPGRPKTVARTVARTVEATVYRPAFLRVVLDGKLSMSARAAVLAPVRGARTLVLGAVGAAPARVRALRAAGADVELLPARGGRINIGRVLRALAKHDVQSLLVEGGATVHAAFIAAGLVDRVAFFYAPILAGGGLPIAAGVGTPIERALRLGPLTTRAVGQDLLIRADVLS
jgi:diaminohydroxyphosphoribosylaminopyrimidine deaminase/5-amino-6-(5-phosphoribosylamino)uracil reductase